MTPVNNNNLILYSECLLLLKLAYIKAILLFVEIYLDNKYSFPDFNQGNP